MSDAWIYCKNMPGCLPDNGPEIIFGHDQAKRYVVDELNRDADFYAEGGDDAAADALAGMAEDVNLSGRDGWSDVLMPAEGADWAYSLERADDGLTLDELAEYRDSYPPHDADALWEIAVDYCTGDNLGTPISAWGPRASDCAPAAVALAWIYWDGSGDAITLRLLDDCMGQVVNDEDGSELAALLLGGLHAFSDVGEDVVVDIVRDMMDNEASDTAAIILAAARQYDDETALSIARVIRDSF